MSCQPATTSALFNKPQQNHFAIANPTNEPKILITKSETTPLAFDKEGLYELFQTLYYWAEDTVEDFDYNRYTSPQSLINDLRNKKDRWSVAFTKEAYNNLISQKSGGFGFSCQDVTEGCHVTFVRIDSPADQVGLKRGDIVTKINNIKATHARIYAQGKELEKQVNFLVTRKESNQACSCSVTPRDYTFKVAKGSTITTPQGEKVGYLRLDSFMGAEKIVAQIDEAFNNFKKESIEKLVIDLRYNSGGSVTVASKLLDKLTTSQTGKEQFTLAWNDDYKKNNQTYRFNKESNSLALKQILFLTTQGSASASELVISAMQPYLRSEDVVVIGDKTHGKPVGMSSVADKNFYYFLINFVVKNSEGFYDYFNGLPVTNGCNIKDDPFHEMGNPEERMLKAALNYVDVGSCK
jgi:C-terminal processing protease CtpA/Prc